MKLICKYTIISLIAFVLVITPVLQGNQIARNTEESHDCHSCCCGCADRETESAQPEPEDNNCCCHMTESEAPVEIPFEGQVQTVSPDTAAELSAQSCFELSRSKPEYDHYALNERANEHGPPLYKINSTYLI
jgi:hypothetical protein